MRPTLWDFSTAASYDFLSSEYEALFTRSASTVFQSPLWMDRLYKRLATDLKADPLIVLIREQKSGALVAVLPLIIRQRRALRIAEFADFGVSDYCAPICDPDYLEALSNDGTIPQQIRRLLKCDLLIIQKIRSDTLAMFRFLGHSHQSQLPFTAHATTLFAPFTEWREVNISASQRRFLDTKRKWLAKRGTLTTTPASSKQDFQRALDNIRQFREFRFRSTGMFNILENEVFVKFYNEVADGSPPARAYIMSINGTPIAAGFALERNGTLHFILSGFDFINYRNASVGLLIIEDIIADCIARGETCMDFTIGNQAYKRGFGTRETRMFSLWLGLSGTGRTVAFFLSRSRFLQKLARRFMRR